MEVKNAIGAHEPRKVNLNSLLTQIPGGNPEVIAIFVGQNIEIRSEGYFSVVATYAIEAYANLSCRDKASS